MSEVTLIGGGVMGAATACFLARDHGAAVTVIERDPSYARASSSLSLSSIRQQFSQPVNMALSRWSIDFLRRVGDELALPDDRPGIGLVEPGYLYLATEAGAAPLRAVHAVQRAHDVYVALLSPAELAARFSWLAVDDLALGSLGLSGEGWFDGPALHRAFRLKAKACGVRFVAADAVGFETRGDRVTGVRCADGSRVDGDAFVIAAGSWSAPLGAALGFSLPVSAKKRDVFVLETPAALPGCPLVIDPSGFWFRTEGSLILAGGPPRGDDADDAPLHDIDHGMFEEQLWPTLAARVPSLEALRVRSAWAGYYEMNAFDHNGLAGRLPGWANAFTACGFSGHGMQQSPAVGWSMARLIAGLDAPLIEALTPQRLLDARPLIEANVI
ncbi:MULTISPECIES: FAD-binding oxidoreductase [unclassified Roseateles]|uniref:NAD(P)/FAD-dependent oxidoreductase n=1 Tax=unclassified Roseateles TaxID=2626991 RepID=UPI0006FF733E|nr:MULTISPECIES: FAD-binding oxidoreductase [unclassified Roseateles]KQW45778.1 FAD-dependent oxidoreductase [Pelomonas sp. Root405]KRA72622.1 FAD-dependent oxidoreductase [Pelomonas sp. Root662]